MKLKLTQWLRQMLGKLNAAQVEEDVPPGFRSHVFVLRTTGVWPTPDDPRWYKWLTIAAIATIGIFNPLSLFVNILFVTSIVEATDHVFLSLTCMTTIFKVSVLYWQCNHIRRFFRIHETLSRNIEPDSENSGRVARVNFHVHIALTLLYLMTLCLIGVQAFMCSNPTEAFFPSTSLWPYEMA